MPRLLVVLVAAMLALSIVPAAAQVADAALWDAAFHGVQADFPGWDVRLGDCPDSAPDGTPACISISERVTYGVDAAIVFGGVSEYDDEFTTGAAMFFYLYADAEGWHYVNTMAIQNSGFLPQPGRDARTNSAGACTETHATPGYGDDVLGCVSDDTAVAVIDGPVGLDGVIWWQLDGYGWVTHDAFRGYARRG